jgi:RES domain-containing protein
MFVFRMHDPRFAPLDATGAALHGGRWHSRGVPVVYTAEHASLAVLEAVIHANGDEVPRRSLTRIHLPDDLPIESAPWVEFPLSQRFGDQWAAEARSAVLRVESIVVNRMESNFVLNPKHPQFSRIEHEAPKPFPFDPRFFNRAVP